MFSADSYLQFLPGLLSQPDRHLHQLPHPFSVERGEGVIRQDPLMLVFDEEAPLGVVPGDPEGHLGEIVSPEGEELRDLGDLVGGEGGPGDLDHRPEFISDLDPLFLHHPLGHLFQRHPLLPQFVDMADQGDHHLGEDLNPFLRYLTGSLKDRSDLHLHHLGHVDPQADPSEPQHRIGLAEALHPFEHLLLFLDLFKQLVDLLERARPPQVELEVGQLLDQLLIAREELMERRVDQSDDHGQAVHHPEELLEVPPLEGE